MKHQRLKVHDLPHHETALPIGKNRRHFRGNRAGDRSGPLFQRHHCGDWGDLCDEDEQANEDALANGNHILRTLIVSCVVTAFYAGK